MAKKKMHKTKKAAPKKKKVARKVVKKKTRAATKKKKPVRKPVKKVKKAKRVKAVKKPKKAAPVKKAKKIARVAKKPKAVTKKPVATAAPAQEPIGRVTHYYDRIGVAVVKLQAPVRLGENIILKNAAKEFAQRISSMQQNHQPLMKADKDMEVGMKMDKEAKEGTLLFRA